MEPVPPGTRAQTLRAAASAVIFDARGRILLQRRSDNGRWGLPGGGVEVGESVSAAAVREVREETGLDVEVIRLIGLYSDPAFQVVRYPDGNVVHYVSACFECRVVAGALALCDETLALDWFDPRALPADVLPIHRRRIEDALARRPEAFVR
ncbi:MAG TPA: NUDIX domain-containing protein [Thermodesulfobacteriota bacterium]